MSSSNSTTTTATVVNPWAKTTSVKKNNSQDDASFKSEYTQMYGAQESIMFLIDTSKQMFEKNIDGIVPMENALTLKHRQNLAHQYQLDDGACLNF